MEYQKLELTDGVITIRPFTQEDARKHLAGEDKEQVMWLSKEKGTLEGIKKWIKKNQDHWENDGPVFNFAVLVNQKLAGMVEANTDPALVEGIKKGEANISYGLYPQARRKGYVSRAVNLIMKFLREKGIKRAIIRINPKNKNSLKIPLRCGFEREGMIVTKDNKRLIKFIKNL